MNFEVRPYGKTNRLDSMQVTITEKLDGTNACVVIEQGEFKGTQSRKRAITPGDDNFGFASWAYSRQDDLLQLGDGYHYGEWVGPGIQKNPHNLEEKKFFLFNTARPVETLPDGVNQVPILYQGDFLGVNHVDEVAKELFDTETAKGNTPEGIIVYFHSMRLPMKYTFHANKPKWMLENA